MLAGMLYADALAMMAKHFIIERPDQLKLLRKPRWTLKRPAGEIARNLPRKPRPALSTATDHDSVRAGARERRLGVVTGHDVAVDNDRNRHRLFDGAHRRPVGPPLVELATRAAVNRDERYARCLRATRQFRRIYRAVVPTESHLQGYGYGCRGHGRIDKTDRVVEIAHQRRPRPAIGNVPRRAAHVDVND